RCALRRLDIQQHHFCLPLKCEHTYSVYHRIFVVPLRGFMDFTCSLCGTEYHTSTEHVGARIRCTKCSQIVEIQGPGAKPIVLAESCAQPTSVKRGNTRRARWIEAGIVAFIVLMSLILGYSSIRTRQESEHPTTESQL